ncbi:hypothetical protein E3N88_31145 [Mikania micrantha]|uniref:Uncharacterized protein n=1 Tax=Mikania micrantha TaxID=192012 RepID=A0A5N6MNK2_9ASTR|nr:hypothetical protein E3N88_31145 [Mikania micrantha]
MSSRKATEKRENFGRGALLWKKNPRNGMNGEWNERGNGMDKGMKWIITIPLSCLVTYDNEMIHYFMLFVRHEKMKKWNTIYGLIHGSNHCSNHGSGRVVGHLSSHGLAHGFCYGSGHSSNHSLHYGSGHGSSYGSNHGSGHVSHPGPAGTDRVFPSGGKFPGRDILSDNQMIRLFT